MQQVRISIYQPGLLRQYPMNREHTSAKAKENLEIIVPNALDFLNKEKNVWNLNFKKKKKSLQLSFKRLRWIGVDSRMGQYFCFSVSSQSILWAHHVQQSIIVYHYRTVYVRSKVQTKSTLEACAHQAVWKNYKAIVSIAPQAKESATPPITLLLVKEVTVGRYKEPKESEIRKCHEEGIIG